jgi:hypothetical protein
MMALRFLLSSLLLLVLWAAPTQAQSLRDPTQPPPSLGLPNAPNSPNRSNALPPLVPNGISLVVRQGKTYLVLGNRLYTTGQQIGAARIERITETEVWWREAGVLRKQAVFPGIERRAAAPTESRFVRSACQPGQPSSTASDAALAISNEGNEGRPNTADDFCHKAQP